MTDVDPDALTLTTRAKKTSATWKTHDVMIAPGRAAAVRALRVDLPCNSAGCGPLATRSSSISRDHDYGRRDVMRSVARVSEQGRFASWSEEGSYQKRRRALRTPMSTVAPPTDVLITPLLPCSSKSGQCHLAQDASEERTSAEVAAAPAAEVAEAILLVKLAAADVALVALLCVSFQNI